MFDSVLVANRGEIAIRIIRACRDLGLRSIAVHSDADRDAPHVALADDAVRIGTAPPADSYLHIERIVAAALSSGAGAVHPGYGFLAENASFAQAVADAGLVFVGPPPSAITLMGDKVAARRTAVAAGVPVVPGSSGALTSAFDAADFGFPVALKALYGGGGRGMRVVHTADALPAAFDSAVREATLAFGRGEVYAERYLERPRHIEVQVLADTHGTVLHLGDRDCSLQRRHQKLIEEAPAFSLDPDLRRAMGEAAVRLARHVGYVGAGTCEFLLSGQEFWFLEMNTRLQVEHPVTELVTGVDLVAAQLRVARGEPLGFTQEQVRVDGHAIEVRINAEDPASSFAPRGGVVTGLVAPQGPWVRFDTGLAAGQEITPYYDSLIGKLVTWGASREEALRRMSRALAEIRVDGPATTLPFHRLAVGHPQFVAGEHSTVSVETEWDLTALAVPDADPGSTPDDGRSALAGPHALPGLPTAAVAPPTRQVRLTLGDRVYMVTVTGAGRTDVRPGAVGAASGRDRGPAAARESVPAAERPGLLSPIAGMVTRIEAKDGDDVLAGDAVCVIEAMKMENIVVAHRSGRLALNCAPGQAVEHRAVLATIS